MFKKNIFDSSIVQQSFDRAMIDGNYEMAVDFVILSGVSAHEITKYINQNINKFNLESPVSEKLIESFIQNNRDLDSNEFLFGLYKYVLGREPDTDGYNYWLSLTQTQNVSHGQLLEGFVSSPEAQNFNAFVNSQIPSAIVKESLPVIRDLNKDYIASIDLRYDQKGDYTPDGFMVTSFDNVKRHVDMAEKHGFTAIELDLNVPINADTGELQLIDPREKYNGDKFLPADTWKIISYAESLGLDTSLRLNVVNVLNDSPIMDFNVGPGFDVTKFFASMTSYETMIAQQSQIHGVDQIVIGTMNFGFDSGYRSEWAKMVSSIKTVYSGELSYESFYQVDNVVVWDLVDNIAVKFETDLGPARDSVTDIASLYLQTVDNSVWGIFNPYQRVLDLVNRYDGKDIMLYGISKSPIQTALNEKIQVNQIVYSDEKKMIELSKLDFDLLEKRYDGFFEFFGNYLDDKVDGLQFWSFAPWADADWIQNGANDTSAAFRAYAKGGYFLNSQPETLDIIDDYLLPGWGYNTLDMFGSNDNAINGFGTWIF